MKVTISIVSHGQGDLIAGLLDDLSKYFPPVSVSLRIFVTLNVPEDEKFLKKYDSEVTVIRNDSPLGFGANHNQAFKQCACDLFLVVNPDIRLSGPFWSHIINVYGEKWGCIAPLVKSSSGAIEDSARKYPNIIRIINRVLLKSADPDYILSHSPIMQRVDWLAGMFLVFKSEVFKDLNGFDERYFMYLEDADICRRCNEKNLPVFRYTAFSVVHEAQRQSRKSLKYFSWHVRSMIRFICGF